MSTGMINVLALVDTTSIMSQGGNTWYLVDDDSSSSGEGTGGASLTTNCSAGDTLYFRVVPVVEGSEVAITAIGAGPTGAFVFGFNQPLPPQTPGGPWSWQTQNQASGSYSLHVLVGGVVSTTLSGFVTAGAATAADDENKPRAAAGASRQAGASGHAGGLPTTVHQIIDIVVAADTQAIIAGAQCGQGNGPVYMVDNNPVVSTSEGSCELNTGCNAGDTLRWHVVPINGTDPVIITGFEQSQPQGGVFGPNSPKPAGDEFTWQTAVAGSETYQIRLLVNGAFEFRWDPFVTVGNPQSVAHRKDNARTLETVNA
jgi:hypothetical protein